MLEVRCFFCVNRASVESLEEPESGWKRLVDAAGETTDHVCPDCGSRPRTVEFSTGTIRLCGTGGHLWVPAEWVGRQVTVLYHGKKILSPRS